MGSLGRRSEETYGRDPSGRTTTPDDVVRAIAALRDEHAGRITGNVVGVDGGEEIAG